MKKIAIIGASYLQEPLIQKAKDMGIETHVFAWAANDIGEKIADYFYPISIIEKEAILEKCKEIGIDGICSIASDLAVVTVNYVAERLGLIGNGDENTELSTNKHNMRVAFEKNGDPSPKSILVTSVDDIGEDLKYPLIVKPLDRSGSRGIYKISEKSELSNAIAEAKNQGFIKKALVEEYVEGTEYSVECISYKGEHHFLALTYKYTTGAPHFIEIGHFEPAQVGDDVFDDIKRTVLHALDTLKIKYGASHSEIKVFKDGSIKIIEIGARMGGDFIGSTLVKHSSGIDFVKAVIQIALGERPDLMAAGETGFVGIRFICEQRDIIDYKRLKDERPDIIIGEDVPASINGRVTDSSSRFGYYIIKSSNKETIETYMPKSGEDN